MKLFHGTNRYIDRPDLSLSRKYMDFGKGFYLSIDFERAVDFARRKVDINGGFAVVYQYLLSDTSLSELNVKTFDFADEEWFDFIVANRTNPETVCSWDLIIGATADDRVRNIINQYIEDPGLFDKQTMISRLRPEKYPRQYVIKTNRALERLSFVEKTLIEG